MAQPIRDATPTPPVPEPPWWRSRHDAGRRGGLSREAIVEAALEVLDADGLDGLTMRRLARHLGVGAASLYWYVDGKEALLQLVIDRVMGEIVLPEPDPEHWQQQLKAFARDCRDVMARYRDIGRATLGRVPVGPNLMRVNEWVLGLLTAAGVPPRAAAWTGDVFGLFLGAHAYETDLGGPVTSEAGEAGEAGEAARTGAAGTSAGTGETGVPAMVLALMDYMRSLPPASFPNVHASLGHITSGDADERFEFGLDLLVRGLASYAADGAA